MNEKLGKLYVRMSIRYIEFVYDTSKVEITGSTELLNKDNDENVVLLFWHGDSYCLYPALRGSMLYVLTTADRRGDYITDICRHFGYETIRVPDESTDGQHLFHIRNMIKKGNDGHLAVATDGPLGPYHLPKSLTFVLARLTGRRLVPVSFSIKRKISINKRWDKYKIPLPFNEIEIRLNSPIGVSGKDRKNNYAELKEKIIKVMEGYVDI